MTNDIKWSIDPEYSEIGFKVKQNLIGYMKYVKGSFRTYEASIYTGGNRFDTAIIDLRIDTASVTTGDPNRDKHLKSADFFDVKNHRHMTFVSTAVGRQDTAGIYEFGGELIIKGIVKHIKLNAEFGGISRDLSGKEKAMFTINGTIKRSDWGLVWNAFMETGGLIVSDEIHISGEVVLVNEGQGELVSKPEAAVASKSDL